MSFIDVIHGHLTGTDPRPLVSEVSVDGIAELDRPALAALVARVRGGIRARGVRPGDRVVLLAANSIHWVALDLAILEEGAVSVPLYPRQALAENLAMMQDCEPALVIVDEPDLWHAVYAAWPDAPLSDVVGLVEASPVVGPPQPRAPGDIVTIVYTSGTSGEAKGVCISVANVDHMLPVTSDSLCDHMDAGPGGDRVYHYLPLCFMGSRIVLWTCLWRENPILLGTDLDRIVDEIGTAEPHYFLNVPVLLERVRAGAQQALAGRSVLVEALVARAERAWSRLVDEGRMGKLDTVAFQLADRFVFSRIRARFGPNLQFLICGSAPLAPDTQRWFAMIGVPVYQVYGLTETTAIVSMDRPDDAAPGWVGHPVAGCEVRLGEGDELLVRGPHVFEGYWRKPEATAGAFADGWFRTGDRAEIDADGRLRVLGRVKHLIVPSSGHNVAPEPIEAALLGRIPGAEQVVLLGHGRKHLVGIVTGVVTQRTVDQAVEAVNADLPHYKRVRGTHLREAPLTHDEGLITANGKLRRDAIEAHFADAIEALYT